MKKEIYDYALTGFDVIDKNGKFEKHFKPEEKKKAWEFAEKNHMILRYFVNPAILPWKD